MTTKDKTKPENKKTTKKDSGRYANCKDCMYSKTCPRLDKCEFIDPVETNTYTSIAVEEMVEHLRSTAIPYPVSKLGKGSRSALTSSDNKTPLYDYYAGLVNDCLDVIRHGRTAYAYHIGVIKELLRFEPTIDVQYSDGVYFVSLVQA